MNKSRRLRLLVINDETFTVSTPHIETVRYWLGPGDEKDRIAVWEDHMRLWGESVVDLIHFDLLLIDIKFDRDTTDPFYFGESPTGRRHRGSADAPNAFGLLHALPHVGRQGVTGAPFAWAVHSADPMAVQDDPVAVWAFGMLCAMERRTETLRERTWKWDGFEPNHAPEYFSDWISRLPKLGANEAWPPLVRCYRERLVEAFDGERIHVSDASIANALERATDTTPGGLQTLAEVGLKLSTLEGCDRVSIRSLFADGEWSSGVINGQVVPYLRRLRSTSEKYDRIYDQANASLEKIDKKVGLADAIPPETDPYRYFVGIAVVVCWCLRRIKDRRERHAHGDRADIQLFMEAMGFTTKAGTNYGTLNTWLKRTGYRMTIGAFVHGLEDVVLKPGLRACAQRYCTDILKWSQDSTGLMTWPDSLLERDIVNGS